MTGCTLLHFALLVPAALASQAVRELPEIVNYVRGDDRRLLGQRSSAGVASVDGAALTDTGYKQMAAQSPRLGFRVDRVGLAPRTAAELRGRRRSDHTATSSYTLPPGKKAVTIQLSTPATG
jgi:hypothetical protein